MYFITTMTNSKKYGRVTTLRIPTKLWVLLKKEAELNFSSVASVVLKAVAFYFESKGRLKREKP